MLALRTVMSLPQRACQTVMFWSPCVTLPKALSGHICSVFLILGISWVNRLKNILLFIILFGCRWCNLAVCHLESGSTSRSQFARPSYDCNYQACLQGWCFCACLYSGNLQRGQTVNRRLSKASLCGGMTGKMGFRGPRLVGGEPLSACLLQKGLSLVECAHLPSPPW